jgi:hypothetical protein
MMNDSAMNHITAKPSIMFQNVFISTLYDHYQISQPLPGLQAFYQVDELPKDGIMYAYARYTGRAPAARWVMRGITRLTDFKRGPTMLVMETRTDHNHNQRDNHREVDRLPCGVIFSITVSTPATTGGAQRLDVVGARSLLESNPLPTSKEGPGDAYSDGAS